MPEENYRVNKRKDAERHQDPIIDPELANYEIHKMIRRTSLVPRNSLVIDEEDLDDNSDLYRDMPLTKETTCGFWFIRGSFLQKFANKKSYVLLYGIMGCVYSATYAYFNGTITTLEKRFKIPSRTSGLISVAGDICQIFMSVVLSYYGGKGHKPRWLAFGNCTIVIFCLLVALPHLLYGPGRDALLLTEENGGIEDVNNTNLMLENEKQNTLCRLDEAEGCVEEVGSFYPQLILFVAQFVTGVGGGIYYSLGIAYMDDNIRKSQAPVLISVSYFLRMLGPAMGYSLASFCLKLYISLDLTPTINNSDPRWLGAWWLGWLVLGAILTILGLLMVLFPKTLPKAAARRAIALEKMGGKITEEYESLPSVKDMMETIWRLLKNKTFMYNNLASIFYCFGQMPYWIFMPKYIETQFKKSASLANLVTGTVGIVFSSIGILISGFLMSKFKPKARTLAFWNVFAGAVAVLGTISYMFLGCDDSLTAVNTITGELNATKSCNAMCNCEYVPYSPVCSEQQETFISPCHAGCTSYYYENSTKVFSNCSCITPTTDNFTMESDNSYFGKAFSGNCPTECNSAFYAFLAIVCTVNFIGSLSRSSEFMIAVRCIEEKDKSLAMGISVSAISLFALVPSPIIFGYVLDTTCMVWGKTCTGTGNCWLYDDYKLRILMNSISAFFVFIATLFDGAVWVYVKHLKVFDEKVQKNKYKAVTQNSN